MFQHTIKQDLMNVLVIIGSAHTNQGKKNFSPKKIHITRTSTDQYNWLLMIWHYANVHCEEINLCEGFMTLGRWPSAHQSRGDYMWRTDSREHRWWRAPSSGVKVRRLPRGNGSCGKLDYRYDDLSTSSALGRKYNRHFCCCACIH